MPILWTVAPSDTPPNTLTWDFVDIAIDPATGDIGDSPELTRGDAATLQRVFQRLRFFLGEWFLDTRLGVPWFQQILASRNQNLARYVLEKVVRDTPGIKDVSMQIVDWDRSTRVLELSFTATLISGSELQAKSVPFIYSQAA